MRRTTSAAIVLAAVLPCCFTTVNAQQRLAAARVDAQLQAALRARAEPAIIWRIDDPELAEGRHRRHYNSFSADGSHIGVVYASRWVRLLDADDGAQMSELRPESARRRTYSMALASTGRVAVGRQGSMQIHNVSDGGTIAVFPCVAASEEPADAHCPPTSLAFSPDASLLAFHQLASIGRAQDELGAVSVVDLELGRPTEMDATTALAKLSFATDRRSMAAADDAEAEAADDFRIWHTRDWELPQSMLSDGWTVGAVTADSIETPRRLVAVFRSGSNLVMRDFADDRLLWAAPLIRHAGNDDVMSTRGELRVSEVAPNGEFLISYEAPIPDDAESSEAGSIVIRRTLDGAIVELYDLPGVLDIAIAPDSRTFVYSSAADGGYTALVRVPNL